MDLEDWGHAWMFLLYLLGMVAGGFLCYLAIGGVAADKHVDYCYIRVVDSGKCEHDFVLYGHRNWTDDITMGTFPAFGDAVTAAASIHCNLDFNP